VRSGCVDEPDWVGSNKSDPWPTRKQQRFRASTANDAVVGVTDNYDAGFLKSFISHYKLLISPKIRLVRQTQMTTVGVVSVWRSLEGHIARLCVSVNVRTGIVCLSVCLSVAVSVWCLHVCVCVSRSPPLHVSTASDIPASADPVSDDAVLRWRRPDAAHHMAQGTLELLSHVQSPLVSICCAFAAQQTRKESN